MWPTQGPQTFTCTWIFIRRKHCLVPGSWMWYSNSSSANGCHCSYFSPQSSEMSLSLKERLRHVSLIFAWVIFTIECCKSSLDIISSCGTALFSDGEFFQKKMISTFQEEITDRAKVTQTVSSRLVSILVITLHIQPYHSLLSCSQHTWVETS